jgi:catechol 2,3-dioxygenase-like lactoylglutathione lyase family enzyme
MTPEFTHCALHVRDLDQSIAFFQSYCGLRIVKEHGQGGERAVWMVGIDISTRDAAFWHWNARASRA